MLLSTLKATCRARIVLRKSVRRIYGHAFRVYRTMGIKDTRICNCYGGWGGAQEGSKAFINCLSTYILYLKFDDFNII